MKATCHLSPYNACLTYITQLESMLKQLSRCMQDHNPTYSRIESVEESIECLVWLSLLFVFHTKIRPVCVCGCVCVWGGGGGKETPHLLATFPIFSRFITTTLKTLSFPFHSPLTIFNTVFLPPKHLHNG